jgi:hypothetical protein
MNAYRGPFTVEPAQYNHGESIVLVDQPTGEVVAESPTLAGTGDEENAPHPAAMDRYLECYTLLAAAPAMLAALKAARDSWHVGDDGLEGAEREAYDAVCAAIDGAEGR